eukprot:6081313-Amphidinium_carterae.2
MEPMQDFYTVFAVDHYAQDIHKWPRKDHFLHFDCLRPPSKRVTELNCELHPGSIAGKRAAYAY